MSRRKIFTFVAVVTTLAVFTSNNSVEAQLQKGSYTRVQTVFDYPLSIMPETTWGGTSDGPDSGACFASIAEDFTVKQTTKILGVKFPGGYFEQTSPNFPGVPVNFLFRIFITDGFNDKLPGSMIYEENVTVYPGVDTGLVNAFDEAIAIYGARLTNGPTLQPGQKYWISIMENDPLTQIPFIWMNSDINNGYFAYDPGCNNPQLFETFEFDDWGYAFTLIGNAVQ